MIGACNMSARLDLIYEENIRITKPTIRFLNIDISVEDLQNHHIISLVSSHRPTVFTGNLEQNGPESESVRMSQRLGVVQDSMRRSPAPSNKSLLNPRSGQGSRFSSRHGSGRSG